MEKNLTKNFIISKRTIFAFILLLLILVVGYLIFVNNFVSTEEPIYPLRRRNAHTPDEIEKILKNGNEFLYK
jgi:hypothetical protein